MRYVNDDDVLLQLCTLCYVDVNDDVLLLILLAGTCSVPTDGKCRKLRMEWSSYTPSPVCVIKESVHKCKNYRISTHAALKYVLINV